MWLYTFSCLFVIIIVLLPPHYVCYTVDITWREHEFPTVSSYCYLGIDFASNGAWDVHIKRSLVRAEKK